MGRVLVQELQSLKERFGFIRDIRGKGLILGVEIEGDASKIVAECLQAGLLITSAGHNNVLRFLPPLTVSKREIDRGLAIFEKVLARQ
jgi:acetylornithine aminotransferase/acetylornithine/N-succinyldiaminopimelate aminotransferase